MTEAYGSVPQMTRYYGERRNGRWTYGAHIPFNFALMGLTEYSKVQEIMNNIKVWINAMPNGYGVQPNWVVRKKKSQCERNICSIRLLISVGKPRPTKNRQKIWN